MMNETKKQLKAEIAELEAEIQKAYAEATKLLDLGYENSDPRVQEFLNRAEALNDAIVEIEDDLKD